MEPVTIAILVGVVTNVAQYVYSAHTQEALVDAANEARAHSLRMEAEIARMGDEAKRERARVRQTVLMFYSERLKSAADRAGDLQTLVRLVTTVKQLQALSGAGDESAADTEFLDTLNSLMEGKRIGKSDLLRWDAYLYERQGDCTMEIVAQRAADAYSEVRVELGVVEDRIRKHQRTRAELRGAEIANMAGADHEATLAACEASIRVSQAEIERLHASLRRQRPVLTALSRLTGPFGLDANDDYAKQLVEKVGTGGDLTDEEAGWMVRYASKYERETAEDLKERFGVEVPA